MMSTNWLRWALAFEGLQIVACVVCIALLSSGYFWTGLITGGGLFLVGGFANAICKGMGGDDQ